MNSERSRNATLAKASRALFMMLLPAGLMAASAVPTPPGARADFEVVDCLLPSQVRGLGNRNYLAQRKPTHTTAADCRIRGGEYVAYDRADLRSALNVWLPTAETGDADAQLNVGEIYERGVGGPPDYAKAAEWYRKAADQGSVRAKLLLGALYEQGLGVERDPLAALNLYRESAGIKNDLEYQSTVDRRLATLRSELQTQVTERDAQIAALEQQVSQLQRQIGQQNGAAAATNQATTQAATQVATLQRLVAKLREERNGSATQLAKLPSPTREPAAAAPVALASTLAPRVVSGLKLGRFYALVIGNQTYTTIERLQTPLHDADRAAALLRDRYGFNVQLLRDADDVAMLRALNDLNAVLKPEDNLLIYYAGHGTRLNSAAREAGYWLPVNAEAPPKDTYWVPNEQITAHLGRLQARRVLVIADSCYAGLLSDDPGTLFIKDPGAVSLAYVKFKLPKRARMLISSGGDKPVLDVGAQGNSVFSRAFLEVLEKNTAVLSAPALFVQLQAKVKASAAASGFRQVPEFKSIKGAGHEFGDFFFVPR
jgi:hypothetical protein